MFHMFQHLELSVCSLCMNLWLKRSSYFLDGHFDSNAFCWESLCVRGWANLMANIGKSEDSISVLDIAWDECWRSLKGLPGLSVKVALSTRRRPSRGRGLLCDCDPSNFAKVRFKLYWEYLPDQRPLSQQASSPGTYWAPPTLCWSAPLGRNPPLLSFWPLWKVLLYHFGWMAHITLT